MFFDGSWVPGGSLRMLLDPKTLKNTCFFMFFNDWCLIFYSLRWHSLAHLGLFCIFDLGFVQKVWSILCFKMVF